MAVVTTAPGIRNIMLENAQTFKQTSNKTHVNAAPRSNVDIIDIRRDRYGVQTSLKEDILSMLQPESGERQMPTLLLYNERGLQLFEDVSKHRKSTNHVLTVSRNRSHICPSTI